MKVLFPPAIRSILAGSTNAHEQTIKTPEIAQLPKNKVWPQSRDGAWYSSLFW
jgi:hypothetical protein